MKLPILSLLGALVVSGAAVAQTADNTAVNARDRDGTNVTPIDQSNDPADIRLAADIRKMVVADKRLSATAKNAKIIVISGKVTLRGPVEASKEKVIVETLARKAGAKEIVNELEIKKSNS